MSTVTSRRMRDEDYRAGQWASRYAEPVAPVNHFVDALIAEDAGDRARWMPYVAPIYSARARVLTVFRDPGPKTQQGSGSGMLSMENDDPSAELCMAVQTGAGLSPSDICPWNIAPWYVNRAPKAAELDQGGDLLVRLLDVLARVEVVVLHGGDAHDGWRRLSKRRFDVTSRYRVMDTFHTSAQAFISPDPAVREARRQHLVDTYAHVRALLDGGRAPETS